MILLPSIGPSLNGWDGADAPTLGGEGPGAFPSFGMEAVLPQLIVLELLGEGVPSRSSCEQRARANARWR